MNEELTGWFPGDVKPVREGVYERKFFFGTGYSRWNGYHWMSSCETIDEAALETYASPPAGPWRGLAKEPK